MRMRNESTTEQRRRNGWNECAVAGGNIKKQNDERGDKRQMEDKSFWIRGVVTYCGCSTGHDKMTDRLDCFFISLLPLPSRNSHAQWIDALRSVVWALNSSIPCRPPPHPNQTKSQVSSISPHCVSPPFRFFVNKQLCRRRRSTTDCVYIWLAIETTFNFSSSFFFFKNDDDI